MVKKLFVLLILISSSAFAVESEQKDLKILNQARALYAQGKLNEATELYSQITADSDFWLDSLEERAWAYTREKKYEKALGDLKSITNKVWAPQVGPETMMLSAFVSLKICAYKDVIDKVEKFKTRMIPRIEALEEIIENPATSQLMTYLRKSNEGKLKMSQLGKKAENYPRYFFRDQTLLSSYKKDDVQAISNRMKVLAQKDLNEIEKNLKKMKIIEVEVIQRVFTADEIKKDNKKLSFEKYDRNTQVSFPADDEEVWVDEVGHYEVKAQQCPQ